MNIPRRSYSLDLIEVTLPFYNTYCHTTELFMVSRKTVYTLQTVEEYGKVEDSLEMVNANLRADLDRWHIVKKVDMKQMIQTMADGHIQHYDQVFSSSIFIQFDVDLGIIQVDMPEYDGVCFAKNIV